MIEDKIKRFFENDNFVAYCGMQLMEFSDGQAKARVEIRDHHMNAAGIVHGGVIFTLADFCLSVAANVSGKTALTINGNISFISKSNGGILYAEAKRISKNNTLQTYSIEIKDEDGNSIAYMTGMSYMTELNIKWE